MTVLYFTPEAEEQAQSIDRGWREHAQTNPDLFTEELEIAQSRALQLREVPVVYAVVDGEPVRRVYMPRARHHLYYVCDRELDAVIVVAIWGSRREHGPPL